MRKHAYWQAKCNWNAEISMTLAKLLRESLCFTMIRPSLHARWTRRRWPFGKQAKPRKQTGCRTSYANDIRITLADNYQGVTPPARCSLFGNSCDTPRTVADFDAAQLLARFYIND